MQMKTKLVVTLMFLCVAVPIWGKKKNTVPMPLLGNKYVLERVIEVPGRQGIAVDSNFYYISDTKALYKLNKKGEVLAVNNSRFSTPR